MEIRMVRNGKGVGGPENRIIAPTDPEQAEKSMRLGLDNYTN